MILCSSERALKAFMIKRNLKSDEPKKWEKNDYEGGGGAKKRQGPLLPHRFC